MNWIKSLRVRTTILIGFALNIAAIVFIGYSSIGNMEESIKIDDILDNNAVKPLSHLIEISGNLERSRSQMRDIILYTGAEQAEVYRRLQQNVEENNKKIADYEATILTEAGKKLFSEFKSKVANFREYREKIIQLAMNNKKDEAIKLMQTDGLRATNELRAALKEVIEQKRSAVDKIISNDKESFQSTRTKFIFIIVGASLASMLLGFFISNLISKPINELTESAEKMAGGDNSVSVREDAGGEIGVLQHSFNKMVENIRQAMDEIQKKTAESNQARLAAEEAQEKALAEQQYLARSASEISRIMNMFSEGDLTVRATSQRKGDEIDQICTSFNNAVDNIAHLMQQVMETITTTASASAQISASVEELNAGIGEESQDTNEISAAVIEMTQTIAENANNARMAAETAAEAGKKATVGGEVVNKTIISIEKIVEVVYNASTTVEKLGQASDQIGNIVQVIDEIADQTNLLALNAAIEAARAGEMGRGFAVVADEVRKLAERTSVATKEIASTIQQIQRDTTNAVTAMKTGTTYVTEGKDLVEQAGTALSGIITETKRVKDLITQVATASEQQGKASIQIEKNMEGISNITKETALGSDQIAHAIHDLSMMTHNLNELISQFKLGNSSSGVAHATRPAAISAKKTAYLHQ